jgi:hypothetical protein
MTKPLTYPIKKGNTMANFTETPVISPSFGDRLESACINHLGYFVVPAIAHILLQLAEQLENGKLPTEFRLGDKYQAAVSLPDKDTVVGEKFAKALKWANEKHLNQVRKPTKKGDNIPYISHLISVAAIVLQCGGSETAAIVALCHDVIEDIKIDPQELSYAFGEEVLLAVLELSEDKTVEKSVRKKKYANSTQRMSAIAFRVSIADKLHNLRCYARDPELATEAVRIFYADLLAVYDLRLTRNREEYGDLIPLYYELVDLYKQIWILEKTTLTTSQPERVRSIRWINGSLKIGDFIIPWGQATVDLSEFAETGTVWFSMIDPKLVPHSKGHIFNSFKIEGQLAQEFVNFIEEENE